MKFNNEYGTALVVCEMKLVGFDVYIAGKNVIKYDVFNERSLIVLLVVETLDVSESYGEKLGGLICLGISTLGKGNAVVLSRSGYEAI